jgi:uncharacterized FlaG/YvyC family protein
MNFSVGSATATAAVPAESAPRPVSEEQRSVIQAVKAVNGAALFGQENEVTFVVDRFSHLPAVRIVNKTTREVVAQIPSETVLELAAKVRGKQGQ